MGKLEREAVSITGLLAGKTVKVINRFRPKEVLIEFTDGTRFFIDSSPDGLDFSITELEQSEDLTAQQ